MRYIDEYRDPVLVRGLLGRIGDLAGALPGPISLMEVCGSHTQAIGRYGIRGLLPSSIRLISGPGCPVCVTSVQDVDAALFLARRDRVILATFGDMVRVPGTGGNSLQQIRAAGADIRVVSSPADCLALAEANETREVVFLGIGFETTSPTVAATVLSARRRNIQNFSVFSVHKVIPPAIRALIDDPDLHIDGFICPGHVSTIIGSEAYRLIPAAGRAAVVTGFEPVDVLEGILMILQQIREGRQTVAIQYSRGVKEEGNPKARAILDEVFETGDARWRGLGSIPASGLFFRPPYEAFDATKRFAIPDLPSEEIPGCSCGDILRGAKTPDQCPLFRKICHPLNPVGPCMVSTEGTCSTHYRYP